MFHRTPFTATLNPSGTAVGQNQTAAPVSIEFNDAGPGMAVIVAASVTAVTNTNNPKLRLQQASKAKADGTFTWSTVADSAALTTGAAEAIVEWRASVWDGTNGAKFPLGPRLRVVAVTGASDAVTVGEVKIYLQNH